MSSFLDESFESRKTAFHPSNRPYLFPESSSAIHAEEDFLGITQAPRRSIGVKMTSYKGLLKLGINTYGIFRPELPTKRKHFGLGAKKSNLKEIIIKENIKKGIKCITNKLFKKHIFNIIKNQPINIKPSNI